MSLNSSLRYSRGNESSINGRSSCRFGFCAYEANGRNFLKENKLILRGYSDWRIENDCEKELSSSDFDGSRVVSNSAPSRKSWETDAEYFYGESAIVEEFTDMQVVYPVHLNPLIREAAQEILGNDKWIHLIEPLDVIDFHNFSVRAYLI